MDSWTNIELHYWGQNQTKTSPLTVAEANGYYWNGTWGQINNPHPRYLRKKCDTVCLKWTVVGYGKNGSNASIRLKTSHLNTGSASRGCFPTYQWSHEYCVKIAFHTYGQFSAFPLTRLIHSTTYTSLVPVILWTNMKIVLSNQNTVLQWVMLDKGMCMMKWPEDRQHLWNLSKSLNLDVHHLAMGSDAAL